METPNRAVIQHAVESYKQGNPNELVEVIDFLTLECAIDMFWVIGFFATYFNVPELEGRKMVRKAYIKRFTH